MKVIRYNSSSEQNHWLEKINTSDWNAAKFLYKLLKNGAFFETLGEGSDVLLLTDGDELISFCTYSKIDDIPDTDLTPWVGFVFTFPKYRGNGYIGKLFEEVAKISKERNVEAVYLSTNHIGLYEKYGFVYYGEMIDMDGCPSRIYTRKF